MRTTIWHWVRAVVAGVALAGILALAVTAAPAFGAAAIAAHQASSVQWIIAGGPDAPCQPAGLPCP
jgi:hypothetical protein